MRNEILSLILLASAQATTQLIHRQQRKSHLEFVQQNIRHQRTTKIYRPTHWNHGARKKY